MRQVAARLGPILMFAGRDGNLYRFVGNRVANAVDASGLSSLLGCYKVPGLCASVLGTGVRIAVGAGSIVRTVTSAGVVIGLNGAILGTYVQPEAYMLMKAATESPGIQNAIQSAGGGGGTTGPRGPKGPDENGPDPKCDDYRRHILEWLSGGQEDIINYHYWEDFILRMMLRRNKPSVDEITAYNDAIEGYNNRLEQLRALADQMRKLGCPDIPSIPQDAKPLSLP